MRNLTERIIDHPFFRDMKQEPLATLFDQAREITFAPGEILFCEGEPANQMYLIETGCIALEAHEPADGTMLIQNLGAGEVLGWSWLFPPYAWHFRARAAEPTTVIVLNGAHLLTMAEEDHEFGFNLMKRVAQVMIHHLQATRKQLLACRSASIDCLPLPRRDSKEVV
jgi:CRP/FNR family transcriptional regulator, cyclic AMP receptor protein